MAGGNVRKSTGHPLVPHRVPVEQPGLVLFGEAHQMDDEIGVIVHQGRILNPLAVAGNDLLLPSGIQNLQMMFLLVPDDGLHRGHPALKQTGHLLVNLVDLPAGSFQGIHRGFLLS